MMILFYFGAKFKIFPWPFLYMYMARGIRTSVNVINWNRLPHQVEKSDKESLGEVKRPSITKVHMEPHGSEPVST